MASIAAGNSAPRLVLQKVRVAFKRVDLHLKRQRLRVVHRHKGSFQLLSKRGDLAPYRQKPLT